MTHKSIYLSTQCQKYYQQIISQDLILKQNYRTIMELPSIKKIILNTTSKLYVLDKKYIIPAFIALELLSGQKMKSTYAKKSIATFKIRKNQTLGCKTTLRDQVMYTFLHKFVKIILTRIRDFSGNLDYNGNLSIGMTNCMIFPELENNFELFESLRGFNITFVVSTQHKQDALLLYTAFQIPIEH